MAMPAFLRPLVTVVTWPVARFADVRPTYDLALAPSDARAVLRGAIGTDPMYLSVGEGIAANCRSDVVGQVDERGRFQIYVGGRGGSGLGLVGRVSDLGQGSRIEGTVGWTGLHRWLMPVFTMGGLVTLAICAHDALTATSGNEVEGSLGLAATLGVVWLANLYVRGRNARIELPAILQQLERVLAPHRRRTEP